MSLPIPEWATAVPNYPVHTEPARTGGDILPPFTWQQMQNYFFKILQAFIGQVAIAFGAIEIEGWHPFGYLTAWGEAVIAAANEGQAGSNEANAKIDGIAILMGLLTGNDFLGDLDIVEIWENVINTIFLPLRLLLGPDSPLSALNLFNLIPVDLLGQISISSIGGAITNLITDPFFLDADSFLGLDQWFQDPTGGFDGTGTAYTIADGSTKELLGNLIAVSAGQVMPITGKVKWTGLAGTGTPIALAITGYTATGASVQATVASHGVTPPTTDWIDLAGTYTVPANVVGLRTRLVVAPAATAGTVYFSTMSATKTQPMLQRLIAGTNAGTFLPDDIEGLFSGVVSNTQEILNRAGLADFNDLVSVLEGNITDAFDDVANRLNSFLDGLSPLNADNINTGNIADIFVPGLGTIHDGIVTTVGNLTGAGFDINKMLEVLSGQTHAIVDAGAGITNMFARLSNLESKVSALPVEATGAGTAADGAIGVQDIDNFERVSATDLGPTWLQYYSSGAGIWATPNGHDATFAASGVANREFLCVRNNPEILRSATDYQRVTLELSSKAARYYDAQFNLYNYIGHDDIWLRVSDATTSLANVTGIRIRWGGDGSLSIARFINGIGTALEARGPGFIVPPGPGACLIGEAGILADGVTRSFRAKIGASIRLQANEVGTASGLGIAYRRWGHGGRAEGHSLPSPLLSGQQIPGGAHYWNGMDQTLI